MARALWGNTNPIYAINTFRSAYLSISLSRFPFPILSRNDTGYSVGCTRDRRDGGMHIRTFGTRFTALTEWNGTGATHRNHFSGFARRNVFSTSYWSAQHARGDDLKILPRSVGPRSFLQCDLDSTPSFRRENRFAPALVGCERRVRRRYVNTVVVCDGYSPPKVWHVSGGAQVSALTTGRALENDIAGVITGRRVLSRGQHPENKRGFTVSVSFWHGPLMPNHFATPKVFLNLSHFQGMKYGIYLE